MKLAILMGILLELMKNKVSAKQLALKFETSTRTIYRYIEELCQSGIPVVSIMGKNGGFGIDQNFKMDNLFFTLDEIDELLLYCKNPFLKEKLLFAKQNLKTKHKIISINTKTAETTNYVFEML